MSALGITRLRWLAVGVFLLAGAGLATAQLGGGTFPPAGAKKLSSNGASGTSSAPGKGGLTDPQWAARGRAGGAGNSGWGGQGGGLGGLGGFGLPSQSGLLTPEQEQAVLLDTLATAETLFQILPIRFRSEGEVLFLLMILYEIKYAEAVDALGGTTTGGMGTGGTTTGTTPVPVPGGP